MTHTPIEAITLMEESKKSFVYLLDVIGKNCGPERAKLLLELLTHEEVRSKLLVAPASSSKSYHHAFEGGLLNHINQMTEIALNFRESNPFLREQVSTESIVTVCVLHDIHKVCDHKGQPYYITNLLKSGKVSDAKPFKVSDENSNFEEHVSQYNDPVLDYYATISTIKPSGHLSMLTTMSYANQLFISLTDDEKFAIINHGGAYETSGYSLAGKENALQIMIHAADMLSSRYDDAKWK
jgi:hypothetical protein